jgi:hypothetical protein
MPTLYNGQEVALLCKAASHSKTFQGQSSRQSFYAWALFALILAHDCNAKAIGNRETFSSPHKVFPGRKFFGLTRGAPLGSPFLLSYWAPFLTHPLFFGFYKGHAGGPWGKNPSELSWSMFRDPRALRRLFVCGILDLWPPFAAGLGHRQTPCPSACVNLL